MLAGSLAATWFLIAWKPAKVLFSKSIRKENGQKRHREYESAIEHGRASKHMIDKTVNFDV
jgi:hypothetical protein